MYLFISYGCFWVFNAVRGLSLAAVSLGFHFSAWASLVQSAGFRARRPQSLKIKGSVVVDSGLSCSGACGIFPQQGLNPCFLHRQADSYSLYPQGHPCKSFLWRTVIHPFSACWNVPPPSTTIIVYMKKNVCRGHCTGYFVRLFMSLFSHLGLQTRAQPRADVTLQSSLCLLSGSLSSAPSRTKLPEDRHSCVFSCTVSFPGSCNITLHTADMQWKCLLIWVRRKTSDSESGVLECF